MAEYASEPVSEPESQHRPGVTDPEEPYQPVEPDEPFDPIEPDDPDVQPPISAAALDAPFDTPMIGDTGLVAGAGNRKPKAEIQFGDNMNKAKLGGDMNVETRRANDKSPAKRPESITGSDEQQFDDSQDPALDKGAGQTASNGVQGGTVEQAGMRDSASNLNDLT